MPRALETLGWSVGLALATLSAAAGDWPQYRGPGGSGLASPDARPPVLFGPGRNLRWKVALPAGHSSPVVWKDRIFLTGFEPEGSRLQVLCLDRKDGAVLWRRETTVTEVEKVHSISNPATATVAVDGERVYAYFGSAGLFAYSVDGKPLWSVPMPVAKVRFGSGTSPVVAGDRVILSRDGEPESFLLAVDRRTGRTKWKQPLVTDPSSPVGGHATPVVWNDQVVLHRPSEIAAFDLDDGARRWSLDASTTGTAMPVASPAALYVATWNNLGEPDLVVPVPTFASLLAQHDRNGDGGLSFEEFPDDLTAAVRPGAGAVDGAQAYYKRFYRIFDVNGDGRLVESEWETTNASLRKTFREHGLLSIKPGGKGDVTATHVRWREGRAVPEVPAPLLWQSRLYTVAGAGVVTCLESATGKILYRERLGTIGPYYASPVAAAGRIYFASAEGVVTVIEGGNRFVTLATNDLEEALFATPAIVGSSLYVRTARNLFAFAE